MRPDIGLHTLLSTLPPETAHHAAIRLLKIWQKIGTPGASPPKTDPLLHQALWDRSFAHPLGLAAGFDKDAEVPSACLSLGFSFVEVGAVTPQPQPGNPAPRLFRLPAQQALINRLGFNNAGVEAMYQRLLTYRRKSFTQPVGINLGKNKDTQDAAADYQVLASRLGELADYMTVNVSSPNTQGLRDLQALETLLPILTTVRDALSSVSGASGSNPPALLVKLSPDLPDSTLTQLAKELARQKGLVDGVILTNTTLSRPDSCATLPVAKETGGLSGPPLRDLATQKLRLFYQASHGKIPLIGCGGISSPQDAYQRMRNGAHLLQIYSAFIYKGPRIIDEMISGLAMLARQDGFSDIADVVGTDC